MRKFLITLMLGASIALVGDTRTGPAFASSLDTANKAASILASVGICHITIPEATKTTLYETILRFYGSPHMVIYAIEQEAKALTELSPSDRAAMCAAIVAAFPT